MVLRSLIAISMITFSSIFITSCSGMVEREKMGDLQTSIRAYGQAIRWARYKNAHDFHLGKDGFKPKLILEKYNGIQVTAYNIVEEGEINEALTEADVVAEISYYSEDYATVNKIKHRQHWWFEEETKQWFLDAKLPEFK